MSETQQTNPITKTKLLDRILNNWKTTVAGTCSFTAGAVGIITQICYPHNDAPKYVLVTAGLAGYITTLLAKDH